MNDHEDDAIAGRTVMIVDDNPQNVELLEAFLEALPVRTIRASDGISAMQMVETNSPDLILLDIMMPRMSGFEVCKKLKQSPQTADIPVVIITALNEMGDIERAVECGTDDFLSQPVNKLELLTRVRTLLKLRHLKNELDRALSYLDEMKHPSRSMEDQER